MKWLASLQRKKVGSSTNKLTKFAVQHKLFSAAAVAVLLVLITVVSVFGMPTVQRNASVPSPEPNTAAQAQPAIPDGPKLDIPQAAIDNTKPAATRDGACKYQYSDGNGNYYIAVHLANGSYKCLTYNLDDLQDYTGSTDEDKADMALGHTPVKKKVVTDNETGVTTTFTQYSDGTSKTSTEGEYYKLYLDRAATFYVMVNGTEMAKRFQYCMTNGYMTADGQTDVRLLTPDEQAQRAAQPYPYAGPDCNAGGLPEVHY